MSGIGLKEPATELTPEQARAPKVLQSQEIYFAASTRGILDHCIGLVGGYPIWGKDKGAGVEWALVAAPYMTFDEVLRQTPEGVKAEIVSTPDEERYNGHAPWVAYTLREPTRSAVWFLGKSLPFYSWPPVAIATLLPRDSRYCLAIRYDGEMSPMALTFERHLKHEFTAAGRQEAKALADELLRARRLTS